MQNFITVCSLVAVICIGSVIVMVNANTGNKQLKIPKRVVSCDYPKCVCQAVAADHFTGDSYCCDKPNTQPLSGYLFHTVNEHCDPPCAAVCNDPDNPTITGTNYCCPPPPPPSCFPSSARVSLENGKSITMAELQIGDKVQTVSQDGTLTHSKVRAFLKKQYSKTSVYKSISTSSNGSINLSGNHLIYARNSYTEKFNPMYADLVSDGDEVLVYGNDEIIPVKVTNVTSFVLQGAHVPLTKEGNIMVDGVLASCYPSTDHDLAHSAMTPMLWFPETGEWIFGNENGFQGYVKIVAEFARLMLPYGLIYI